MDEGDEQSKKNCRYKMHCGIVSFCYRGNYEEGQSYTQGATPSRLFMNIKVVRVFLCIFPLATITDDLTLGNK